MRRKSLCVKRLTFWNTTQPIPFTLYFVTFFEKLSGVQQKVLQLPVCQKVNLLGGREGEPHTYGRGGKMSSGSFHIIGPPLQLRACFGSNARKSMENFLVLTSRGDLNGCPFFVLRRYPLLAAGGLVRAHFGRQKREAGARYHSKRCPGDPSYNECPAKAYPILRYLRPFLWSVCEVLPKSWTKVMRQSHFEFCIGQDLTHSIFL